MEALEFKVGVMARVVLAVPEGMLKVLETESRAWGKSCQCRRYQE